MSPSKKVPIVFLLLSLALATDLYAWQMKQAPLMTQWASQVDTNNPLPEYPRPQMVRTNWLNLNGIWQFQAGATNDPVPTNQTLSGEILVPYAMESAISGVMQYQQFSWYRRLFTVPMAWSGKRIILHLDAVDWQSQVFINGQSLGVHKGGYDPFSYDITAYLNGSGSQELIVKVYSPVDNGGQPRGKQTLYPGGIMYTSSSGVWQPVWLEPVDSSGVQNLRIIPDVDNNRLRLTVNTFATNGVTVTATVLDSGTVINSTTGNPQTELDIPIPNPKLWSPSSPFLYDLRVSVIHGGVTNDSVTSYFGMRKISTVPVNGVPKIFLNNQFLFEMGPLDQGFWPDGIYTAPSDAALAYDIQQEKALGFNMVRKHIKVERQRWYYWADKLGIMVWQDMPSCNSYTGNPSPPAVDPIQFIVELSGMVTNHWNSPAIIMWDLFNEAQGQQDTAGGVGQTNTAYLAQLVKTLDPSRLVNQASGGNYYGVGDVFDVHSYPAPGNPTSTTQAPVDGEFGGIGFQVAGHLWNPALAGGNYIGANTTDDIAAIYDGFVTDLISFKPNGLNAAVYTQITDVENEENGLMTYDRLLKPDLSKITKSNEKAITGQLILTTVVPTSQSVPQTWQYTTSTPATNWYATNFNATGWSSGPGGFGTPDPGVTPNTTWNTPGYIYLRRTFNPGALTPQQINNLVFNVYHDEDVAIYLNGVLAGSASGYSTSYVLLPMTPQAQAAIIPNGTNVLAVSCYQSSGGQFIDVGISDETLVADTLTVPTDYGGYWPLDATSGAIAIDASGNGNNGTLNGASWSANGKINGCLAFNGVNNYAQISRTISNDFSICYWVKTTQTGGTGQWYQGDGLVDGDSPGFATDFGTSLTGGKFAFGVGNPDTTIYSATSINDGVWHHCVATRARSTGAMSVYVDGNLEASGTGNTNSLIASANLRFGQIESGGGYFNGNLDEIKIYNRALGHLEIAALYDNSAFTSAAPTNLTAIAANGQVALEWDESVGATSYVLSRSTHRGGPYTLVATLTATRYTDTSVANGTTYYYVVSAINAAGQGANSSEVSATPYAVAAWFKADTISGLTNGAAVATWNDVSGNGNNATQTVPSQRPTYITGAINGKPVVRFNGAGSDYLAFPRPVQDDFTILCVFRSSQGIGTGTAFFQGAGLVNGEVAGVMNDFGTSLNANGFLLAGTGNPDTTIVSSSSIYTNGQPHFFTFKRTRATGALVLYADGVQVGAATGGTQSLTSPPRLVLGAQQTMLYFFTGDIAEVKIFNTPLLDSDRAAEESALKCAYGLGAGAAPGVPTGLAATVYNGQVGLNWSQTAGATGYNLKRSTNGGGTYSIVAAGIFASGYTDTNAVYGYTNSYVVSAMNSCGVSADSAPVSVPLTFPLLGAGVHAGAVTITWPDTGLGWELWSTTNLNPPALWSQTTNAMQSSNGQVSVTVPIEPGAKFFRLRSP